MRLATMGAVIIGLGAFFIYLTTRLASPELALLYGDLDSGDSSRVISQLESQGIAYKLQGNQIMVPSEKVARLRMSMADQGLPSGGSIGYEIFDNADSLGTTNFTQNVNLIRALEGELARSIRTISSVKAARVHLVMPRRDLFSRANQEPSASVVLKMSSIGRLGQGQITSIQHLVAAAIPGLTPGRISIVDNKGTLLARGFDGDDGVEAMARGAAERRRAFEGRLSRTLEVLLGQTVGSGKVRAEVSAEMDFDRISTSEETYDPDGQVVRSTQSVEQTQSAREADNSGAVTVGGNLPDANLGGETATSSNSESSTEETVNFEISKKVVNHVRETGTVKRLSVAVLVDGTYTTDDKGNRTYEPRDEKEMKLLAALVRGSIGFNADRGDSVEVINMQFADVEAEIKDEIEFFFGLEKEDLMRMAEILVLSIVAILVILLVVRPLISRAFESMPPGAMAGAEGGLLADHSAGQAALTGPGAPVPVDRHEDSLDEMIDLERIEGRVKASSVKKVGEIVQKHPDEALSIIRNWLYQES